METKQTAVQWLIEQIKEYDFSNIKDSENWVIKIPAWVLTEKKEQALQMERDNNIEFAKKCLDNALDLDIRTAHSKVEDYYNETYGGQDE